MEETSGTQWTQDDDFRDEMIHNHEKEGRKTRLRNRTKAALQQNRKSMSRVKSLSTRKTQSDDCEHTGEATAEAALRSEVTGSAAAACTRTVQVHGTPATWGQAGTQPWSAVTFLGKCMLLCALTCGSAWIFHFMVTHFNFPKIGRGGHLLLKVQPG